MSEANPYAEQTPPKKVPKSHPKAMKFFKIVLGVIVAIFLFIIVVASCAPETTQTSSTGESTNETTEAPATEAEQPDTEATATETPADADQEAAAPAPTSRQLPPGIEPNPNCEPDESLASFIDGVLIGDVKAQNIQVIKDGNDTWIGASLVRPDGKFESRSDVWLLKDGGLFAVSNGAQNNSNAISHPDISYNMTNELAHGVDSCVVVATLDQQ